jgi:6-phosphogluconate dehydrogenase
MRLGMIGLGRMGANMAQRLMHGGHVLVDLDTKPEPARTLRAGEANLQIRSPPW